jgi:hypothetical protein
MNSTISKNPLLLGGVGATAPKTIEEVAKTVKPEPSESENIWLTAARNKTVVRDSNNHAFRPDELWAIQARPDSWIDKNTLSKEQQLMLPATSTGKVPIFQRLIAIVDGINERISKISGTSWIGNTDTPEKSNLLLQRELVQDVTITLMKEWVEAVDSALSAANAQMADNYKKSVEQQAQYNADVAMATERIVAEAKAAAATTPTAENSK